MLYTRHLFLVAESLRIPDSFPDKSALGKGWGAWGEGGKLSNES